MAMPQNDDAMTEMVPPWIAAMRRAAQAVVTADDITEIVRAQVAAAKKGDRNAMKFVFEQVLGGAALKGATFAQHNYYDGADPRKPTSSLPGSPEKERVIRKRLRAGLPAFDPADQKEDIA